MGRPAGIQKEKQKEMTQKLLTAYRRNWPAVLTSRTLERGELRYKLEASLIDREAEDMSDETFERITRTMGAPSLLFEALCYMRDHDWLTTAYSDIHERVIVCLAPRVEQSKLFADEN
jgi:hypothetical protein